ncbi:hypothetical protein D3C75_1028390 [compost metagenome]
MELQPIDCFVGRIVQIGRRLRYPPVLLAREDLLIGGGDIRDDPHVYELLGDRHSFRCPVPGIDVVRHLTSTCQVHGDLRKLHGTSPLEEKHLVVLRNRQQIPKVALHLPSHLDENLGPMTHFHDGRARIAPIE